MSYLSTEQENVLESVLKLSEKYRIVIHLYYYEGYNIKEISKILKKPSATIGTWLSRAKAELKNYLKEDFDNE